MTKKKVNLDRFDITRVENGWEVRACGKRRWFNYDYYDDYLEQKTYVFADLKTLMTWLEKNI